MLKPFTLSAFAAVVLLSMCSGMVHANDYDAEQLRELMEQLKDMGQPNEAQMNMIVDQAGKMQSCLHDLDNAELATITGNSESLMAQIQAWCAAGQRDAAQEAATAFAARVGESKALKRLDECSVGLKGLLPTLATLAQQAPDTSAHVCDSP